MVDDDAAIRDSLALLLESEGLCVQQFSSCYDFLSKKVYTEPACILLDVCMPDMGGLELLLELKQRRIRIPTIMMTAFADVPLAVQTMQNGAVDFIEKPIDSRVLLQSINRCLERQHITNAQTANAKAERKRLALLTCRERQVMDLLVQGNMNKQIATRLVISPRTVEVHRARIKEKLGVSTLAGIVRIALLHDDSTS
ncbi:response regulator transcription factor [Ghiorsea bivora]|uniref:response regulator transcription factor n=1 Tax=Ghiorsea bivora TaxID=1485545 RepID=UPI000AB39B85|nr:response regulator [Ghiorsea bivora]